MKIFQVDAFTSYVFGGNPAAVCPLEEWLPDKQMQLIAMENNLSETAFFVKDEDNYHIRWFTPEMEIDLCGHATLASAHVIFNHLGFEGEEISFRFGGGMLSVKKAGSFLSMDFPAVNSKKGNVTELVERALDRKPLEVYEARDLMAVFESQSEIESLWPDFNAMLEIEHLGVIVTAPGDEVDFVSRFFAPRAGINEDPATGSAHCMLIPFWADKLDKNELWAYQLSSRGGELFGRHNGDRVEITGKAVTYMTGEILI